MTKLNDLAFPVLRSGGGDYASDPITAVWSEGGLTKREYFAAKALQGLLAGNHAGLGRIPRLALEYADEIIKELERNEK